MGIFSSLFGSGKGADMSPLINYYNSQYSSRLSDINDFAQKLDAYNTQFTNALGNLYNTAYMRHVGNLNAAYGAKGIDVNGGAFASELARSVADYSAQMIPQVYQNAANAANTVEKYRADAWSGLTGGVASAMKDQITGDYAAKTAKNAAIGDFLGKSVGQFTSGFMGGNPFTMAGQGARSGANNLFSGSGGSGGGYAPAFDMQYASGRGGNPYYGGGIPGVDY